MTYNVFGAQSINHNSDSSGSITDRAMRFARSMGFSAKAN